MTFRHAALLHEGIDGFVDACAPLLTQTVEDGGVALVATDDERISRLRDVVGSSDRIDYVDMTALGRNPARVLSRWREFARAEADPPRLGIGGPVWPGRSEPELAECHRHEALVNLALAETDMALVCPYDTSALAAEEVAAAERTHPRVVERGEERRSGSYRGPNVVDLIDGELSPPMSEMTTIAFGPGDLARARRDVAAAITALALPPHRVHDVVLCTSELVANAIEHGAGNGLIRVWPEPDAVVCEVSDRGRIVDPLVGRDRPDLGLGRGRGIWMVNQICDLVELRSSARGTVVRCHVRAY